MNMMLSSTAALVAGSTAVLAGSDAPNQDAELLELGHKFDRAAARMGAVFQEGDRLHQLYIAQFRPKVPEDLRATDRDRSWYGDPKGLDVDEVVTPDSEIQYYGGIDMSRLRREASRKYVDDCDETREMTRRAAEIVTAYEAWKRADKVARCVAGLEAHERCIDASYEEVDPIADTIIGMSAHTIDGLMTKARVAWWCHCGDIGEDKADTTFSEVSLSLVRDLLRVQGLRSMSAVEFHKANPFAALAASHTGTVQPA